MKQKIIFFEKQHKMNWWVESTKRFAQLLTITDCISISTFTFLFGIPIGITSSAIGLKICAIGAAIKKCKSIMKIKKRSMIK